ncbi:MAG: hypothetical protein WCP45_14905, partial [Verrucomicrobiota bacterium]
YRGLLQTPLTDAVTGRPYLTYSSADLAATVHDLLQRARDIGLPIPPPATLPAMFQVPKMAFRAASCASALEDALKWLPDAASRMDYATTPPTLRLTSRVPASATLIGLDVAGHGVTALDLQAMPEARALFVSFVYAVRRDALLVDYSIQQAGDQGADAHRALSIYLSGHERSEMLVSEALVTSSNALLTAQASLTAANASVAAVNAQISADYAAAVAAIPGTQDVFSALEHVISKDPAMTVAGYTIGWQSNGLASCISGYFPFSGGSTDAWVTTSYGTNYTALHYSPVTTGVVLGTGWAVPSGTFTDAQLATAGATKKLANLSGRCVFQTGAGGYLGFPFLCSGYVSAPYMYYMPAPASVSYCYHDVAATPVDWLSAAPSTIRAAITAAAAAVSDYSIVYPASATNSFFDRAAFVEVPADHAAIYFARQYWMPYKGQLTLSPTAQTLPGPGDFVSISGTGLPAEHATMATPVAELSIDLSTGSATVSLGPPARMTFASLQDRLRIPPEDNYQAG